MSRIKLLDCTLRDGGLGFLDLYGLKDSSIGFTNFQIDETINSLSESNIDYIEIGLVDSSIGDHKNFCIFKNLADVNNIFSTKKKTKTEYAVFFTSPENIDNIPERNLSVCSLLRVTVRYSDIKGSLDFCEKLKKKGYKVSINISVIMRYSTSELEYILKRANEIGVYSLYIVDTYGYMTENNVIDLYKKINSILDNKIYLGFHAHNNLNLALSNTIKFLNITDQRPIIIDSCILGMGRGAGNLQTELIFWYLNKFYNTQYNLSYALKVCDNLKNLTGEPTFGYSIPNLLSAIYELSYKYTIELIKNRNFSYVHANRILKEISGDDKHRFSKEKLDFLVKKTF